MNGTTHNIDPAEVSKFEELASRWWDPGSEFKPLHDINPLRLDYIRERTQLQGRRVIDVGCGGGLLSEGMAQLGAQVTGIDMGEAPLTVARLHQHETGVQVDYQCSTAEQMSEKVFIFDIIAFNENLVKPQQFLIQTRTFCVCCFIQAV